jgi:hypothetical protein
MICLISGMNSTFVSASFFVTAAAERSSFACPSAMALGHLSDNIGERRSRQLTDGIECVPRRELNGHAGYPSTAGGRLSMEVKTGLMRSGGGTGRVTSFDVPRTSLRA